jgi:DNA primase
VESLIIPEATIQKIKDEADIVKIIGEYVKLEKKGNNFLGLCPFHADSNPSLTVSPSKKIYKCFSCNASGNVLTFIQNHNHVSFVEAVRIVGEKCGIAVETSGDDDYRQSFEKYYKILQNAANFYEFFLKNTTEGQEAREYLHKRNLSEKIIKRFRIGLAPRDNDLLYQSLLKDKFQPLDMIEAGIVRSANDQYFDVFRNRIVFPLEDLEGHIVGFSGRIYQEKSAEPKYLNSSENKIFRKGNILYNYFNVQNEIRQQNQVFLFEGFMDVIAAYRAGVTNAVASMGTALTVQQIKALMKLTTNITVCYDGDNPGIEAARKAIFLLTKENANVKAVLLPEGLDPDEYLKKAGPDKLADMLQNQALSGIEFLYAAEKRKLNPADLLSVETFKNEIFKILRSFQSQVLTEKFLDKLAVDLNVSRESLVVDFRKLPLQVEQSTPPQEVKRVKLVSKYLKSERQLLRYSLESKDFCLRIKQELDIDHVDKDNREILQKLYNYYRKNEQLNREDFQNQLTRSELLIVEEILNSDAYQDFTHIEIERLVGIVKQYNIEKQREVLKGKPKDDPSVLEKYAGLQKQRVKTKFSKKE